MSNATNITSPQDVATTTTLDALAAINARDAFDGAIAIAAPYAAAAIVAARRAAAPHVASALTEARRATDAVLATLEPETEAKTREALAAAGDVCAAAAALAAATWTLARLVGVPAATCAARAVARQPREWLYAEAGLLLFLFALYRFRRWVRTSPTLKRWAASLRRLRGRVDARRRSIKRAYGGPRGI